MIDHYPLLYHVSNDRIDGFAKSAFVDSGQQIGIRNHGRERIDRRAEEPAGHTFSDRWSRKNGSRDGQGLAFELALMELTEEDGSPTCSSSCPASSSLASSTTLAMSRTTSATSICGACCASSHSTTVC
jgi:hypothetical protein